MAKTAALIAMVQSGDAAAFWNHFDARLIRRHQDLSRPHEDRSAQFDADGRSCRWRGWGSGPPWPGRACFASIAAAGLYQVRWTWPQQRFSERVHPGDLSASDPGREMIPARFQCIIDCRSTGRVGRLAGGAARSTYPRSGATAAWSSGPWSILGFQRFASHPLVLGACAMPPAPRPAAEGWLVALVAEACVKESRR